MWNVKLSKFQKANCKKVLYVRTTLPFHITCSFDPLIICFNINKIMHRISGFPGELFKSSPKKLIFFPAINQFWKIFGLKVFFKKKWNFFGEYLLTSFTLLFILICKIYLFYRLCVYTFVCTYICIFIYCVMKIEPQEVDPLDEFPKYRCCVKENVINCDIGIKKLHSYLIVYLIWWFF